MTAVDTHAGYLLTRGWRDTADGVDITLWAATGHGPLRIVITGQEAVCFIEREHTLSLPADVRRTPLALRLLGHGPVDGLYCRRARSLQALREQDVPLCESDIKPADRYLMERFVRAGLTAEGEMHTIDGVRTLYNPRLKPADVAPTLSTLSLDIETRGSTQQLYSIAGAWQPTGHTVNDDEPRHRVFMVGTGEPQIRSGYELVYCADERAVLQHFFRWLHRIDPDIIIGWSVVNFDLQFLDRKCQSLGLPFALGRGQETAAVLQPGNRGQPRIARVPGRAVMDGIELLKAGFWAFDSFSLDNVAHELLGTGKLITPEQDKVAEINRQFRDDKPQLADYNLRDCTLVQEIFDKADLIAFAVQRANLTGLALDRLGGSVAAFDNLYLPRLHRRGFVAPDVNSDADGLASPGGYVLDSLPGLYDNVLVFDFKSLYPSIIRTFFVDPLGLAEPGDDPVPGFLDATFSRDEPILPTLIEALWAARDDARATGNAPLSQAIKIIMNSFYGVLGTSGCRFHSPQLASSITRRGHEIITRSRDWIEARGLSVIYGDTDSLFVLLGDAGTGTTADAVGTGLMRDLNTFWSTTLMEEYRVESRLEVEFETHYTRFLMPTVRGMPTGSKKRYAGLVNDRDGNPTLVVKGLEAARTDWTPLARDFQRELFRRVFLELGFDDFVRETAARLASGHLDDSLVYRKRLRRQLDDYQRNVPPHVQAARKLPRAGNWVRYVITVHGPEPVEQWQSPIDYQHYLDKQLAPAADGILQFVGTSFATITDAQMDMF